jgi:hypothetical protein
MIEHLHPMLGSIAKQDWREQEQPQSTPLPIAKRIRQT